jgi:hypothetical protein
VDFATCCDFSTFSRIRETSLENKLGRQVSTALYFSLAKVVKGLLKMQPLHDNRWQPSFFCTT